MNRVSMSTRADSPDCGGTFRSREQAGDLRLLLDRQRAGGPGDADEVGADAADVGPDVQHAAGAAADRGPRRDRGHRVAERDDDGVGVGANEQPVLAGVVPAAGMVENTRPPELGRVATAVHGIVTSSASGAPDTSGAVTSETLPSAPGPCGHRIVAVVCFTGSSGTSPHSTIPASPATAATNRAMRCARGERCPLLVARDAHRCCRARGSIVCDVPMSADDAGRVAASRRRTRVSGASAPGSTVRCVLRNRDRAGPVWRPGSTA